ncbi:unnamed protein product [Nippostrongylus brasiliensis]|uniref:Rit1_C domain-containing protein n=1 Tax=Nippostrongylus brasiliensis TaxID=27835 RepID=A0A0N4YV11_NIPBR|nr:unnamed protein product [Nippostrongylus brasiliensis]
MMLNLNSIGQNEENDHQPRCPVEGWASEKHGRRLRDEMLFPAHSVISAQILSDLRHFTYIISQTYRQFCAPVFRPCLAYAWVAAGYVDDHPGPFTTPTDYAFNEEEVVMPCQGREESRWLKIMSYIVSTTR